MRKPKTKGTKCPTCNEIMTQRFGDVVFPVHKKIKITDLTFLECYSCGEKVFDHEAQVKIQAAVQRKMKSSAA
jgi:uncharacterized protein with PIN domain